MNISEQELKQFQQEILSWYEKNKRDLPWREVPFDTSLGQREPYKILVSEVMSQQTQLSRVVPKYLAWMRKLPTVESLASTEQSTVLSLWSGLGYNRRAINLQKAAQIIVNDCKGVWPQKVSELEKLPGIGKYTAAAISCFAFNAQIPVIDTNVRKVILTKFKISNVQYQISNEKEMYEIAQQLLPEGRAYEWNQALMDYSALMLKKEKVSVPKQSKFLGSRRSYRGRVIKLLVKHHTLPFTKLWELSQDSHSQDEVWFEGILDELVREGLIKKKKDAYFL